MKQKHYGYAAFLRPTRFVALAIFASAITLLPLRSASAQTFQVIHNFTNGGDGGIPPYTLAKDAAGHFFGTANSGGQNGAGIVFKLISLNSQWVLTPLYNFTGEDGQPG